MVQETEPKEFVSIQELVEICGLSDSTLYRLAKQNKLPGAGWEAIGGMERDNSSGDVYGVVDSALGKEPSRKPGSVQVEAKRLPSTGGKGKPLPAEARRIQTTDYS